jgi:hypothetical protein
VRQEFPEVELILLKKYGFINFVNFKSEYGQFEKAEQNLLANA